MASELQQFLTAFVLLALSFHRCHALDGDVLRLGSKDTTMGSNQPATCETLKILLPSETNISSVGNISYHLLLVGPDGKTMTSSLGCDASSLYWNAQCLTGNKLFLALVDTFGTSLAVVPAIHMVTSSSQECQSTSNSPRASPSSPPKISSSVFGRLMPCGTWELSVSGGRPPYTVSIVALNSGTVYNYSLPSGEHMLSYTHSGVIFGRVIGTVSDVNGVFGTTSIVDITGPEDTSGYTSDEFSECRGNRTSDLRVPFRLHESPRPRSLKYRRSSHTETHMHPTRSLVTIGSSHGNTIAVAVCVSLGGVVIVAMAIYVLMMHRRRQRGLIAGQDALPRPFEISVPAATVSSTSAISHELTSGPILDISREDQSQKGRNARLWKEKGSIAREPSLQKSISTARTVASQPRSGSSPVMHSFKRDPSYSSTHTSHDHTAGSSFDRSPSRSRAYTQGHTQPDPVSLSISHIAPGQSTSSHKRVQLSGPAGVAPIRSASVEERRTAKRADFLSRSASEQYRATASAQRHHTPNYGTHPSSSSRARLRQAIDRDADVLWRPTNHLRHYNSASPTLLGRHTDPESEHYVGREIIFQHQDAGIMHELPPPYHKLVKSDVAV